MIKIYISKSSSKSFNSDKILNFASVIGYNFYNTSIVPPETELRCIFKIVVII